MPTLLQLLTELETLAKLGAPTVEPIVLAGLEALKGRFTLPWEVSLINAAEQAILTYFPLVPTPGA